MNPIVNRDYEASDASVKGVVAGAVAVVLGIAVSLGAAFWLMRPIDQRENPTQGFAHGLSEERPLEADWRAVQAESAAHLGEYDWIDRRAGLARIPIDRAMAIMAAKGGRLGGNRP